MPPTPRFEVDPQVVAETLEASLKADDGLLSQCRAHGSLFFMESVKVSGDDVKSNSQLILALMNLPVRRGHMAQYASLHQGIMLLNGNLQVSKKPNKTEVRLWSQGQAAMALMLWGQWNCMQRRSPQNRDLTLRCMRLVPFDSDPDASPSNFEYDDEGRTEYLTDLLRQPRETDEQLASVDAAGDERDDANSVDAAADGDAESEECESEEDESEEDEEAGESEEDYLEAGESEEDYLEAGESEEGDAAEEEDVEGQMDTDKSHAEFDSATEEWGPDKYKCTAPFQLVEYEPAKKSKDKPQAKAKGKPKSKPVKKSKGTHKASDKAKPKAKAMAKPDKKPEDPELMTLPTECEPHKWGVKADFRSFVMNFEAKGKQVKVTINRDKRIYYIYLPRVPNRSVAWRRFGSARRAWLEVMRRCDFGTQYMQRDLN